MIPMRPIAITAGEPAGIGPEILLKLAMSELPTAIVGIADIDLLNSYAALLKIDIKLTEYRINQSLTQHNRGELPVYHIPLNQPNIPGQLNPGNAEYVLKTLTYAGQQCLTGNFHAVVTGPVNKAIINEAGYNFCGQTEFFAKLCHSPLTVMMLLNQHLRVALATTHLPLVKVPAAITTTLLINTLTILHQELIKRFKIAHPKIAVCGLNPHAGEMGHLGQEEITTIIPAIKHLQQDKLNVVGPFAADTLFTTKFLPEYDAVLAMYHDQGLPVLKYSGFGESINITLGLPIIRTSVDHGTALNIVGKNQANIGSLQAAVALAQSLAY